MLKFNEIMYLLKKGDIEKAKREYNLYILEGGKKRSIILDKVDFKPFSKIKNDGNNMQILIKSNSYKKELRDLKGKWIDINTNYLFKNQYTTKEGLRILDADIIATKNDIRNNVHTCRYCGKQSHDEKICNCDTKYLEIMNSEGTFFLNRTLQDFEVIQIDIPSNDILKNCSLYNCCDYYRIGNNRNKIQFIFNSNNFEVWVYNFIGYKKMTLNQIESKCKIKADIMLKGLELIVSKEQK